MEVFEARVIAFGQSKAGIDWDAPDDQPIHYLFLLATPLGVEDVFV